MNTETNKQQYIAEQLDLEIITKSCNNIKEETTNLITESKKIENIKNHCTKEKLFIPNHPIDEKIEQCAISIQKNALYIQELIDDVVIAINTFVNQKVEIEEREQIKNITYQNL